MLSRFLRRFRKPAEEMLSFRGRYDKWDSLLEDCEGYDSPALMRRIRAASAKARDEEGVFERDSFLLDEPHHSWPALAGLCRAVGDGRLTVLDFGGALGSSYRQCRDFLRPDITLRWHVVELEETAAVGRREFQTDELFFHSSIQDLANEKVDAVLVSGVLGYLPRPYEALVELFGVGAPTMILDRLPLSDEPEDWATIEVVRYSPELVVQFPLWFFSREKFRNAIPGNYRMLAEFDALDRVAVEDRTIQFGGMTLIRDAENS